MTKLAPCPGCSRHVRVSEAACPFCARALLAPPSAAAAPPPARLRMSRTALFAVGATMVGVAACSDESPPNKMDAASDVSSPADAAASDVAGNEVADTAGEARDARTDVDASVTDAPPDFGGGVPIYSAVFPPSATRVAQASPAPAPPVMHNGRSARRRR